MNLSTSRRVSCSYHVPRKHEEFHLLEKGSFDKRFLFPNTFSYAITYFGVVWFSKLTNGAYPNQNVIINEEAILKEKKDLRKRKIRSYLRSLRFPLYEEIGRP